MSITEKEDGPREAIREPALRQAGESLRNERFDVYHDGWLDSLVILLLLGLLVVVEWVRFLLNIPPSWHTVLPVTLVAAGFAVHYVRRMRRALETLDRLKRGMVGEVHVGQFLDDMCRGIGYRVLHDIPGENFNVDHVLIGPGGIFSIEVKHWTKPKGDAKLFYDGERVMKEGGIWDAGPVKQATANADFVRKLVAKRTGREAKGIPVRAVLMVPGWFVEGKSSGKDVWVLGNEPLLAFLNREVRKLKGEDVALFYEAVGTYVRAFGK